MEQFAAKTAEAKEAVASKEKAMRGARHWNSKFKNEEKEKDEQVDCDAELLLDCDELSFHALYFEDYLCSIIGVGQVEGCFVAAESARQKYQCEQALILQCWWKSCMHRRHLSCRAKAVLCIQSNWKAYVLKRRALCDAAIAQEMFEISGVNAKPQVFFIGDHDVEPVGCSECEVGAVDWTRIDKLHSGSVSVGVQDCGAESIVWHASRDGERKGEIAFDDMDHQKQGATFVLVMGKTLGGSDCDLRATDSHRMLSNGSSRCDCEKGCRVRKRRSGKGAFLSQQRKLGTRASKSLAKVPMSSPPWPSVRPPAQTSFQYRFSGGPLTSVSAATSQYPSSRCGFVRVVWRNATQMAAARAGSPAKL